MYVCVCVCEKSYLMNSILSLTEPGSSVLVLFLTSLYLLLTLLFSYLFHSCYFPFFSPILFLLIPLNFLISFLFLSSFLSSLVSPLFFPFHVSSSLYILLPVCFFNLLCNLSLYPPSLHSHHNKQYVTTLSPALQDSLSHLHAATEIARSIKLNSILGANSLPFYQFRHASRYISLCLSFFCYSV